MTRLFWKFFISLFLAQLTTTAVVITLIWFTPATFKPGLDKPSIHEMTGAGSLLSSLEPRRHAPRIPVAPLVVGVFSSLLFAYFLARYFSKPIDALKTGFVEIGDGRFDLNIESLLDGRKDELAELCRDFDATALRLKNLLESQRRLFHDVSHEVRSPLARMQLMIDLLEKSPERQGELLPRISKESSRINRLMDEVLTLARLDSSVQWPLDEVINLASLVSDVVSDVAIEAEQKHCRLECAAPDHDITVKGNVELLHRSVENVLRNAVRFTKIDSIVHITLAQANGQAHIRITDQGPGIPDNQVSYVLEPFARVQGRSASLDGFGLGLAIAAQTLKMHGGTLSAANVVNDSAITGLCVELLLPTHIR